MKKFFLVLCFFILSFLKANAHDFSFPSVPTPFLQGVNLITGKIERIDSSSIYYEFYQEGWNSFVEESFFLAKDDFRIGRVKTIRFESTDKQPSTDIHFSYEQNATYVYDTPKRMTVYRYTTTQFIQAVEQHIREASGSFSLYRCERLFWQEDQAIPRLITRALEDEKGQIILCCSFFYNDKNQLIKETLLGNLSGDCQVSCKIGNDGYPQINGVESYSTTYLYSEENPDLLLAQREENGLITTYQYDPSLKECIAKIVSYEGGILSHYFYKNVQEGFLEKGVIEDGKSQGVDDLKGVTQRQIFHSETDHSFSSFGQLLKNEGEERMSSMDDYGNEIIYTYDVLGRLISTQFPAVLDAWDNPYHPVMTQTYNVCDQITQIVDPKGAKVQMIYSSRGKPVKIVYPDDSYESFSYFLDGALKQKRMSDGTTYLFTRDDACRVIRSDKYSRSGTLLQTLHYTYQGERLHTVTDDQTFTSHFFYDEAGRQIGMKQETSDGVRRLEWSYDSLGQKQQVREWFGPSSTDFVVKAEQIDEWQNPQGILFEDAKGELKYQVHHKNSDSSFLFTQTSAILNSLGQYVKQEEKVDPYGIRHVLTYDALERLENLMKFNSMGKKIAEVSFRYDPQGNKVLEKHQVMVDGCSLRIFIICWNYDACKRLISIEEKGGEQSKTTRYHYNAYGQLDQITKPDGTLLLYTYNPEGQLERFESSDHSFSYYYRYDNLQRLEIIEDDCHHLVQSRHYNAFHELIEDRQGPGLSIQHHYDSSGRRTGLTLPDNSEIIYHYQGPLLSSVERLGKDKKLLYQHSYQYDLHGNLQACQLLNNIGIVNYRYNDKNRLIAIESPWWSQYITELNSYGRPLKIQVQDHTEKYSSKFSYNDNQQLEEEEEHHYRDDSLFNRLSDNGQTWEVNSLNQLVKTPKASYRYDANGNLIEKRLDNETVFYFYDALDRLIRVEYPKRKALTYLYDAFHRRVEECVWNWSDQQQDWSLHSLEKLVYDGFKEIGKVDNQGKLIQLRVLGQGKGAEIGAAIALELQGKIWIPIHDFNGSVRCLIDAESQEVIESYRYSAYGQETVWDQKGQPLENSFIGNPWRFCSKRIDQETGLIFFGKRYYDPLMGRWITPDPLFFCDTPNLYAFNKNDPLNHCDLYGLFSMSQIWDHAMSTFFYCFNYLQMSAHRAKMKLSAELRLPRPINDALEKIGKTLFGESTYLLMGPHFEETQVDCYGEREISDKVRVTFINGILNTRAMMLQSLEVLSESHGGVKIHYVFRPTEGWTWDVSRAAMIRTAFNLGFRSLHAHLLAQMWRALIQEMGGIEGGGTILHYAHSLGGSETDRARELLTPEEQKMIRVYTFGTATLVRNIGFQSVVNHVSINDGVSSFLLEPFGHTRNYFDPDSNIRFYGSLFGSPYWPTDHLLNGPTYGPIVNELGERFLAEFSPN